MVRLYYAEHHAVTQRHELEITQEIYQEFRTAIQENTETETDVNTLPEQCADVSNEQWLSITKDIANIDKYMLGDREEDWVSDRKGYTTYSWVVSDRDNRELISDTTE